MLQHSDALWKVHMMGECHKNLAMHLLVYAWRCRPSARACAAPMMQTVLVDVVHAWNKRTINSRVQAMAENEVVAWHVRELVMEIYCSTEHQYPARAKTAQAHDHAWHEFLEQREAQREGMYE